MTNGYSCFLNGRLPGRLMSLALAISCGGSDSTPGVSSSSAFAGTYQTAVTLTSNACAGITVQNNPTTVAHLTGATTLTLTHAGQTYNGTIASDNSFTTSAKAIAVGSTTHTLTIVGRFTTNAFTADVTAQVSGGASPCQYVVHWVGSK